MTINFSETHSYSSYAPLPALPTSPVPHYYCDILDTVPQRYVQYLPDMFSHAPLLLSPGPLARAALRQTPSPSPPFDFDFTNADDDALYSFPSTPCSDVTPPPIIIKTEPLDEASHWPARPVPVMHLDAAPTAPEPAGRPSCHSVVEVLVAAAPARAPTLSQAQPPVFRDPNEIVIGTYTRAERAAKIARFREKRAGRKVGKRIMYDCRKVFADNRPRVGGRFIKLEKSEEPPKKRAK